MGEYYGKYSEREERMLKQLFGRTSREEKVFHLLNNLKISPNHRNETKLQVACNDVVVFFVCEESATRSFEDAPKKQVRFAKEMEYMIQHWGNQLLNNPCLQPKPDLEPRRL